MPTIKDLRDLQSQTLERKIAITQTRIIEWYQKWNGKVYISFSGGKDSTVLLDIARKIYPEIEGVFVDTGLEYPEIREFVNTINNITILKPKMRFDEVIKTYGYPVISKEVSRIIRDARMAIDKNNEKKSYTYKKLNDDTSVYNKKKYKFLLNAPFKISEKCCDIMKKEPLHNFNKDTGNKPITGQMACESDLRKKVWLNYGCNLFEAKNPISNPMSFWTEQDVLQYIRQYKIPYADIYGKIVLDSKFNLITTGARRTGCVFCCFGVHLETNPNRFQSLKETHPKLWDYCFREENGLGLSKVLDYLDVDYD